MGELFDFPDKTMAIGRLDHDSEGLLLLTTDGMKSFQVRDKGIEKNTMYKLMEKLQKMQYISCKMVLRLV